MLDSFYITAHERKDYTWYMLLVKDTHYCLSCGSDFEKILEALRNCVKRHRIRERLYHTLSQLGDGGVVSPNTLIQRRKYYAEHGRDYEDIVESVVREALKEVWLEDKLNSPLHKTSARLRKVGRTMSVPKKELTKKDSTPTQKFLVNKPKVFKHK